MWRTAKRSPSTASGDAAVKKSLSRYFSILQNRTAAKFLIAKKVSANWDAGSSLAALWIEHSRYTAEFQSVEKEVDEGELAKEFSWSNPSYLDLKIAIGDRILRRCHLCARKCGVDRKAGERGFCGCGNAMAVSSIFAHMGEEPELIPSGTIFTMGCTIRCRHCQNWGISQWKEESEYYSPFELAKEIDILCSNGCRNVNLVGGEPTPWLKHWLETFTHLGRNIPLVWNSNSYYSEATAKLLAGFADVYLLDFKYGPGDCGARISDAPAYWEICTRNHIEAKQYGELIVRVLVLPGHIDCCVDPILGWVRKNLGVGTRVNLMFQYHPEWKADEVPELNRHLTKKEISEAISLAKKEGLVNIVS